MEEIFDQISRLGIWKNDIEINPIDGGITNKNFIVTDGATKFFVRVGKDIPEHGIMRFNELAASRAASEAGISPAVVHAGSGIMVLQHIEAKTLTAEDVRNPQNLPKIVDLIQRTHREIPACFKGPALVFWVFQVLRDYARTLREGGSEWTPRLAGFMDIAAELEEHVGPISLVFGHNDLLPANFMDDGSRLWLIDWDYAGFNSALFDLGGLASNNGFSEAEENALLERYYGGTVDVGLGKKYSAMKCASLLRETMWSMVSEIHSDLDFDYAGYTRENLDSFEKALQTHQQQYS
ncbi:MAG: phosphotransferase family protein [Gammaproteobacteria bacterium]|nr:phosphotransferase family protein [Gammaproteobacteria bacterium]